MNHGYTACFALVFATCMITSSPAADAVPLSTQTGVIDVSNLDFTNYCEIHSSEYELLYSYVQTNLKKITVVCYPCYLWAAVACRAKGDSAGAKKNENAFKRALEAQELCDVKKKEALEKFKIEGNLADEYFKTNKEKIVSCEH